MDHSKTTPPDDPATGQPYTGSRGTPATPGQEALWFLHQIEPASAAYHIARAAWVEPRLDLEVLGRAFRSIVQRHPALRTTFQRMAGRPVLEVRAELAPSLVEIEAGGWSEERLRSRLAEEAARPFDLEQGPLIRAVVLRWEPAGTKSKKRRRDVLLLVLHHIVSDFHSLAVVVRELARSYALESAAGRLAEDRPTKRIQSPADPQQVRGEKVGRDPLPGPLPEVGGDFIADAERRRQRLAGEEGRRLADYWRRRLAGVEPLDLPADRPRPAVQSFRGQAVGRRLGVLPTRRLKRLARRHKSNLFHLLVAAYQLFLRRLTGQSSFAVGTTTAGRGEASLAGVVGYFVNPVALRAPQPAPGEAKVESFGDWLIRCRDGVRQDLMHAELPFVRVAELAGEGQEEGSTRRQDAARSPVFQAFLTLQKVPGASWLTAFALGEEGAELEIDDWRLRSIHLPEPGSQFDLSLEVGEIEGGLRLSLVYATALFDRTTAERWINGLATLLEGLAELPDAAERPLGDLSPLTAAERHQLEVEWATTPSPVAMPERLFDGFRRSAERWPERIALVDNELRLTYGRLARSVDRLAELVVGGGETQRLVGPGFEERVGILLPRGHLLPVALLAVLEAGGTYVPLDPAYPEERLQLMLDDSGARLLLVSRETEALLSECALPRIVLDRERVRGGGGASPAESQAKARRRQVPEGGLAYLIYTSGSTGRPKGVAIEHRSAAALIVWAGERFSADELGGLLAATSVCFDLSVFELFSPLAFGGRVILAADALALPDLPARAEVTLVNTVPSAASVLAQADGFGPSVRTVCLAGEPFTAALAQALGERHIGRMLNLYGPSEDTTYSTEEAVAPVAHPPPAIGRPLPGGSAWVVGEALRPVPIGVAGELVLGGAGLARGYLGRAARTAASFVPSPFPGVTGAVPGARLYRTGDRVRARADGRLDFLGRFDHQVKVRGFRIELGEIMARLDAQPEVTESVVVVHRRSASDAVLVAYVVAGDSAADPEAFSEQLTDRLRQALPEHMVPSRFVLLDQLPRLPNGKLDRGRLPQAATGDRPNAGGRPPSTPTEQTVAALFKRLLVDADDRPITTESDFFALGGHSLLAAEASFALRSRLAVELRPQELFLYPKVGALARRIEALRQEAGSDRLPALVPVARDQAYYPLSLAQERIWFFEELHPGTATYHLPAVVHLRGPLAALRLARAAASIVRRHEVLRSRFLRQSEAARQWVAEGDEEPPSRLARVDLSGLPGDPARKLARRLADLEARRPFDLTSERPVRWQLLRLAPEEHHLLVTLHHIAADGASLPIVLGELLSLTDKRRAEARRAAPALQPIDHAVWQRQMIGSGAFGQAAAARQERLAGAPRRLGLLADPLPAGSVGEAVRTRQEGHWVPFAIPAGDLELLDRLAAECSTTLFAVLAAGLALWSSRTARRCDLVLGTILSERDRPELSPLVGCLVGEVALRFRIEEWATLESLIGQAHRQATAARTEGPMRPGTTPPEVLLILQDDPPHGEISLLPTGGEPLRRWQATDPAAGSLTGPAIEIAERPTGSAKFDLAVDLARTSDGALGGRLEVRSSLFGAGTAEGWTSQLGVLFGQMAASAASGGLGRPIGRLALLTPEERRQLVVQGRGMVERGRVEEAPALDADRPRAGETVGLPALLLDSRLDPVPVGAPGELFVAGHPLPRVDSEGPRETAERCLPDPWSGRVLREGEAAVPPGSRLYRSGELARRLADGRIEPVERPKVERPEVEGQPLDEADPSVEQRASASGSSLEEIVSGLFAEALEREAGAGRVVGRSDDFFAAGGHSLTAARVAARASELFGHPVPLRSLFEHPTVARFADYLESLRRPGVGESVSAAPLPDLLPGSTGLAEHPLSFGQERLWFLDRLHPGTPLYNIASRVRLDGALSVARLSRAWGELLRAHPALRSRIVEGEERLRVAVGPSGAAEGRLPLLDLTALGETGREVADRLGDREARRPFDLKADPPIRAVVLRLDDPLHHLVVTVHHAAADGISLDLVVEDLLTALSRAPTGDGRRPGGLEPALTYGDWAVWQRRLFEGEGPVQKQLARRITERAADFAGAPQLLELPTDRPRPPRPSYEGDVVRWLLPGDETDALEALCRREGVTLFMGLSALFGSLLDRWAGQGEVILGTPVAGRDRSEVERLIGLFVNTVPLRLAIGHGETLRSLLAATREEVLTAFDDRDLPFELLVEAVAPERTMSHAPLAQALIAFRDQPLPRLKADEGRLMGEVEGIPTGTSKLDLSLLAWRRGEGSREGDRRGGIEGWLEYAADLFDRTTIVRAGRRLSRWVTGALADPDAPLARLNPLGAAERQQLRVEWADGGALQAPTGDLLDGFRQVVERHPGREALVALRTVASAAAGEPSEQLRWSYRELAERVRGLAWRLAEAGVGSEVRVGVRLGRSADLVVALLAVLEAGGAYVAIDPAYPPERQRLMLEDAGAEVLITEAFGREDQPESDGLRRLAVGEQRRAEGPQVERSPRHLAYLIYTSGSTGRPKGVAIEHGSAAAMVAWAGSAFAPELLAGLFSGTSVSFDLSIFELFAVLDHGGRVILGRDALDLAEHPSRDEVRLVNTVPSAIGELLRLGGVPANVRVVNLAGEVLSGSLVEEIFRQTAADEVWNLYGPSEDTTYSTGVRMTRSRALPGVEPTIGRPLAGGSLVIVSAAGTVQPIGVVGEIQLGGRGLARGYLGRPRRTAASFVPDFRGEAAGARLYRTGDLGRWLPNGEVELHGRADRQVKVRGYRIELGEIEAALAAHPGVEEAAVAAVGDRLIAWWSGRARREELSEALSARLPAYFVPSRWIHLDEMPHLPNGKINRHVLPVGGETSGGTRPDDGPLRGETERLVASVWHQVLGLDGSSSGDGALGGRSSFFERGGHSLAATRVVSRLRSLTGVELPVRFLFEKPRLADLAAELERLRGAPAEAAERKQEEPLVPRARPAESPLSFAQERFWLLHQLDPANAVYNLPLAIDLEGEVASARLTAAVVRLVERHEILRTVYEMGSGGPIQRVAERRSATLLPIIDLSALGADARRLATRLEAAEARRPFDLAAGPVARFRLLRQTAGRYRLLVNLHHIAGDGWSLGVLFRDLAAAYGAPAGRQPAALHGRQPAALQYADFAIWQRRRIEPIADREIEFWRQRLAGAPQRLDLPADRPRPAVVSYRGAIEPISLGADRSARIAAAAKRLEATPFMLLLAAYGVLLANLSGQRELLVGVPVAGRRPAEVEPLIGAFVNTLVVRLSPAEAGSFGALVAALREQLLGAFAHQDLPFERLVDALVEERTESHPPLVQTLFGLQADPLPRDGARWGEIAAHPRPLETATAKVDLALHLWEERSEESGGATLAGWWEYSSDLFDRQTMAGWSDRFIGWIDRGLAEPGRPFGAELEGRAERPAALRPAAERPRGAPLADPADRDVTRWSENERLVAEVFAEVLGHPVESRRESFFAAGGHSLGAARVVARLRERTLRDVPLRSVFGAPTVAELATLLAGAEHPEGSDADHPPPIEPVGRTLPLPLSFAQEAIWTAHHLEPDSPAYNLPVAIRLDGPLDRSALAGALNDLLRRHEALRTLFSSSRRGPRQQPLGQLEIELPLVDLCRLSGPAGSSQEAGTAFERRLALLEAWRPFDLERGPLLRASLLRTAAERHLLLLDLHHIVGDAWSYSILAADLVEAYGRRLDGDRLTMPDERSRAIRPADFADWQRSWMRGDRLARRLASWRRYLAGRPPGVSLRRSRRTSRVADRAAGPADRRSTRPDGFGESLSGDESQGGLVAVERARIEGARSTFDFPREIERSARQLARSTDSTLFFVLLGAFQQLLAELAGTERSTLYAAHAGRDRVELEELVGCFVHLVPVVLPEVEKRSFKEQVGRLRQSGLEAFTRQDAPLARLLGELRAAGDDDDLIEVAFGVNQLPRTLPALGELQASFVEIDYGIARLDLTVWVNERADGLEAAWLFRSNRFSADEVGRFHRRWVELLGLLLADPDEPMRRLRAATRKGTSPRKGSRAGDSGDGRGAGAIRQRPGRRPFVSRRGEGRRTGGRPGIGPGPAVDENSTEEQ